MNKRHYEHTLPNIRGSLSNTYITYLFVVWIASLIMLRKTIIHLYLTVFLRHEPDNRKAPIKGEKHKKHTNPYPVVKAGKHPITIYRS